MTNSNHKVVWVASNIASLLQDWPDMTWEDVQRINRKVGFAHRSYDGGYVDGSGLGRGAGRLKAVDLHQAWEMAREMTVTDPV